MTARPRPACPAGIPVVSRIVGRMHEDEPLQPPRYVHADGTYCEHVPEFTIADLNNVLDKDSG